MHFRSATRDTRTDAIRLGAVLTGLDRGLASIDRERSGIARRLEEARLRAASLMGTEDGIFSEREPEDEAMLVEAEAEMRNACHRIAVLDAHRALLLESSRTFAEAKGVVGEDPPHPLVTWEWFPSRLRYGR